MANHTTDSFQAAIIGAGIGGLALAMALNKKGVPFTLYEEAKEYSVVGAGIGFGPNGQQAMDLIEDDFRAKYDAICVGNKTREARNVFFEGLLLEDGLGLDQEWHGHSSWGHPEYTRKSAHRKDLLDIMTSYLPHAKVRFNKRLIALDQDADKVTLTFADGEVVEASIVVGADGIKSAVREHVLQAYTDQKEPVYANSYCYRGVIPIDEAYEILGDLTDVAKFYFAKGRSCVTYRITGGKEFNYLLCVADHRPWESSTTVTETVSHEAMMADFADKRIDERFRRLLATANPVRWGLFHHRYTSIYYRDRAVIMGDSAHASLPFQAAGAGQALEDALVLSSMLSKIPRASEKNRSLLPAIHAAFEGYDSVRRPRAQRQLEQSAEVAEMLYFQHPETGSDMNKILPRLQNGRFEWLWFHDLTKDVDAASGKMDEILAGQQTK